MRSAVDRFVAAPAAGAPGACFPVAPAELVRLPAASVVDIAAGAVSGRTPS